jgi:hypothetical protein
MTAAYASNGGIDGLVVAGVSLTPALPSAIAVGDLLIACVWVQGAAVIDTPPNWTLVAVNNMSAGSCGVFYRVATGVDASPALTWDASNIATALVMRFIGADHDNPVGACGTIATGNIWLRGLVGANILTTTRINSLIVSVDLCSAAVPVSYAPGWLQQCNLSGPDNLSQFAVQTMAVAADGGNTGSMQYYGGAEPWAALQFELLAGPIFFLNDLILVNGLAYLKTHADTIYACDVLPETFADLAAAALASYYLGAGSVFPAAPASGEPSGQQLTSAPTLNTTVITTGLMGFWAIADAANSVLLAAGPLASPETVTAGNAIAFSSIVVRLPGVDG